MYALYDDKNSSFHRKMVNEFNNNYSIVKNLNIEVDFLTLTPLTSSAIIGDYGSTIEQLLKKHSSNFDVLYYYSAYSKLYGEHFINLEEYLPEEYINQYDKRLLKEICSSKDNRIVGLVKYIH